MSSLFSIYYYNDINSVVQSFLPGTLGKDWKDPDLAAKAGHLHLIRNLEKKNKICTSKGIDWAVEFQHEDIFYYLLSQKIQCSDKALEDVAFNGNTNILNKMFELRMPFNSRHVDIAASKGHFNSIKIFYKNGVKCSYNGSNDACLEGHIKTIKYLYKKQKLRCTEYGLCLAVKNNHLKIVKHLFGTQRIQVSSGLTDLANRLGNTEITDFLISKGYQRSLEGWYHPVPHSYIAE